MQQRIVVILSSVAVVIVAAAIIFQQLYNPMKKSNDKKSDGKKDTATQTIEDIDTDGIDISFRASDKYFYTLKNKQWNSVYLKGVNMGLTEATTDLANPKTSYETYTEWLGQISEMNANTVKVFTVMPPQFYEALYDFNKSASKKLYLLQGIWFNENYMYDFDTAFSEDGMIGKAFMRSSKETVDIIHGKSDYTDYGEIKNAVYDVDVSKYVAGYILGLEWEYGFVIRTNRCVEKCGYRGEYLSTSDKATAFESFLCGVGDYLVKYETENYSAQTPVAFLNWSTTDTLKHSNEPFTEEDSASVNTENIISENKYYCGQFAALDVYPYYPEFLNYQPEYLEKDKNGKINNYKAYLEDLRKQYTVPVIIAEFGTPTSRGIAHKAVNNMNQGGISEEQQGEYIVSMMNDIAKSDYAGAMIFSWQDEWFKQTWNTYKYAPDNAKERTPNVQSAEQSYGILAMEPGEKAVCLIDGKTDDWKQAAVLSEQNGVTAKAMWDEGYLYLQIAKDKFNLENDCLLVPIQITGNGSTKSLEYNVEFSEAADFLLVIDGKNNTKVLCDAYEDLFNRMYSVERKVFKENADCKTNNSGVFNAINQFLSNEIVLPLSGEVIEPKYYESGKLTYGITDSQSKDFNSLADFYCRNNIIEVRIPWYILNVLNSTNGSCINNFGDGSDISATSFSSIKIGAASASQKQISLYDINFFAKDKSFFHTRLKKSYDIIKKGFANLSTLN